ncbi:MAG TPA: putative cytokinetic ring protein SteA, partial [Streptosporangiaceae bacterium]|nr:putative cytokinetic ring protein SteA [Streptosporangiaceae bacterium]
MKVPYLRVHKARRTTAEDLPGVTAAARLDRRTKNLVKRLRPGEIAIIDHVDLDRVAADALISRQVAAVVNAAASISGRYPNLGPRCLIDAGIPLVDDMGQDVFAKVGEGDIVRLDGETLYTDDQVIAKGTVQTAELVAAAMAEAKAGVAVQLEAFVANTMEYLKRERDLLLDGVGVPALKTKLEGRHVLVVVRGYDYREDLVVLRPYIREYRPVMLGVDGGADALLGAGYVPDIIVGDMDSVSDTALGCGAELVVHAYRDGRAPGLRR